jgi:hypothetical protein
MKAKLPLYALTCLILMAVLFFAYAEGADANESSEPSPVTQLRGYVYELPPQEDRALLAGVTVQTWISPDKPFHTTTTDGNGMFEVEYNVNVKYISFSLTEYTVQEWWHELKKTGDSGMYEIVLSDDSNVNGTHNLYGDSGSTVLMARTNASIFGTVYTEINDERIFLEDAKITISSSTTTISGESDSSGFFSIDCASGTVYSVTISKGGFQDWRMADVDPSEKVSLNAQLIQKSHGFFLGFDLAHTLAIVGMVIIVLVMLLAVYLVRRPEKEDGVYVINDLPPVVPKKKKEKV